MSDIPGDLVALPTMPYSERPAELPLDVEECRTALWMATGNITKAAELLKTTSIRLRNFIKKSPYLTAEMQESADRMVDVAEQNVLEALHDLEDSTRRDTMSRYVLSNIGKGRGWGTQSSSGISVKNSSGGTIVVQWADGSKFGDKADDIEGDVVSNGDITDVKPDAA